MKYLTILAGLGLWFYPSVSQATIISFSGSGVINGGADAANAFGGGSLAGDTATFSVSYDSSLLSLSESTSDFANYYTTAASAETISFTIAGVTQTSTTDAYFAGTLLSCDTPGGDCGGNPAPSLYVGNQPGGQVAGSANDLGLDIFFVGSSGGIPPSSVFTSSAVNDFVQGPLTEIELIAIRYLGGIGSNAQYQFDQEFLTVAATPEPSTWILAGLGLAAAIAGRSARARR